MKRHEDRREKRRKTNPKKKYTIDSIRGQSS
jgi:hypothetical protein